MYIHDTCPYLHSVFNRTIYECVVAVLKCVACTLQLNQHLLV